MSGYIRPVDNTSTQHDGTESLAINDTPVRRLLTRLALNTTARFFYAYSGPCVPISKRLIVKTGPFAHLTEAATLAFIASKTSIPVPRAHCAFVRKNRAIIVMDRIQGVSLAEALPALSDVDRKAIFEQLRSMFQELRSLPPPPGVGIESCVGGSLRDSRIPRSWPRFGPFKTVQEFHLWLRHGLWPEDHPERKDDQDWREIKDMAAKQDGPWPPPVFTHGDLNPSNILVQGNRVTGIIDWEFAGWYPHYWEYTSTWYWALMRPWWQDALPNFLNPHPEELAMEITRRKWWGE
jgi:aminoglycoside phosphotransferase